VLNDQILPQRNQSMTCAILVRLLHNAECLNTHWFLTLSDAREKLESWRVDYNEVRPHGAIGNKPPAALLHCIGVTSPPMSKEPEKSNLRRGHVG
jgi:putative transposase